MIFSLERHPLVSRRRLQRKTRSHKQLERPEILETMIYRHDWIVCGVDNESTRHLMVDMTEAVSTAFIIMFSLHIRSLNLILRNNA